MEIAHSYQALEVSKEEVRVVTLLAGDFPSDISCILTTVSLKNEPIYEALSYVWGDQAYKCDIYLDGFSFPVTINLESALRNLRYSDRPRVLWVDAICINQNDIPERNSQVKYMGTIYSKSSEVVAWLGEPRMNKCLTSNWEARWRDDFLKEGEDEERDNDFAFDTFERLLEDLEAHWDKWNDDIQDVYAGAGILRLLDNQWWNRMWTVQEALLGKTRLICGRRSILLTDLFAIYRSQVVHLSDGCDPTKPRFIVMSLMKMGPLLEYLEGNISRDLEGLLKIFGERCCSDPHDKIYGLLGILPAEESNFINPDYGIDITLLYGSIIMRILHKQRNLDILGLLWPEKWHCTGILTGGGPSWIRDWTAERPSDNLLDGVGLRHEKFPKFAASGESFAMVRQIRKSAIGLRGMFLSSIHILGNANDVATVSDNDKEMIATFKQWYELVHREIHLEQLYPDSPRAKSYSDALSQTFCMSLTWEFFTGNNSATEKRYKRVPKDSGAHRCYKAWWKSEIEGNPRGEQLWNVGITDSDILEFHSIVYIATHMRRLFIARKPRWIGLAPMDAQVGDQIFLLEGGKLPYILRPTGTKDEYRIIGDSYVHGIMDGEGWKPDDLQDVIVV
ncbi:hypothetical protein NHQ30_001391 [Ciborinia camelliae]|nr:hypothetical protein NHQ30_001391 [Ciborinia camelliae]